jgi:hypothetical protein
MIKGQVQLQAWIDPDLREEVRERCHVEGVTIKEFVQQALRLRLAQTIGGKAEEATDLSLRANSMPIPHTAQ